MHRMAAPVTHTEEFYLAAGESGPEQVMPVGLLTSRLIEVATNHANALAAGYEHLMARGLTWVLSRVAIEMTSWPPIDSRYSITTWVESLNKRFSTRCYTIRLADGTVAGYARTVWVAIDVASRTMADISFLTGLADAATKLSCPIADAGRHRPVEAPDRVSRYRFVYSDIDSNRHVNTVRYVQMLLNCWPLDFHDRHTVRRLEISFVRESYFDEEAEVRIAGYPPDRTSADICVDGMMRVHFEISFN